MRRATPASSATDLIVRHLAGRSLVLVLDNCEHVIGEAAALTDTLVGAVPGRRLIATSREPLGIPGEVLVPVGGLAPAAAVELFADRARAVWPGFLADGPAVGVIEDICRRLDALPLAVELAAARLRALPLATLAERLDDRFRAVVGAEGPGIPALARGPWACTPGTGASRTGQRAARAVVTRRDLRLWASRPWRLDKEESVRAAPAEVRELPEPAAAEPAAGGRR